MQTNIYKVVCKFSFDNIVNYYNAEGSDRIM